MLGDYPLIDYDFPAKCVLFVALLFAVGVRLQQIEVARGQVSLAAFKAAFKVVAVPTGLLASGFAQDTGTGHGISRRFLHPEKDTPSFHFIF